MHYIIGCTRNVCVFQFRQFLLTLFVLIRKKLRSIFFPNRRNCVFWIKFLCVSFSTFWQKKSIKAENCLIYSPASIDFSVANVHFKIALKRTYNGFIHCVHSFGINETRKCSSLLIWHACYKYIYYMGW